jgi:hypothetical protein
MNTDKLLTLLDQHRDRQSTYRLLTARYRGAAKDVAKQQAELTVEAGDLAEIIVTKPASELVKVSPDEIADAGISEAQIKRLIAAKRLAERLQGECEVLAGDLKQSQALADRLVEYASQRGESVQL